MADTQHSTLDTPVTVGYYIPDLVLHLFKGLISQSITLAPNLWLILSTPHSTLHVFEWGTQSKECESFHTQDSPFKYMDLSLEF